MGTSRLGLNIEGFGLALLGFLISRLAVAESITVTDPLPFVLTELPPLLIGLGLAVAGVVLAVGSVPREYVRTVTMWAGIGCLLTLVAIGVTGAGLMLRGDLPEELIGSNMLIANVLLAGTVGGSIIGDRSYRNRRNQRRVRRQADRARFTNRILRHEVLNASTIIQGYSELPGPVASDDRAAIINDAATRISRTVDDLGDLSTEHEAPKYPVNLREVVDAEVSAVDTPVSVSGPEVAHVRGNDGVRRIVRELLMNAITHGRSGTGNSGDAVSIDIARTNQRVTLSVHDPGPGLPDGPLSLLSTGTFRDYDDPDSGFGLQAVRLLADRYDADIEVQTDEGTTVSVTFRPPAPSEFDGNGVTARFGSLAFASFAAVVAGVVMGVYLQLSVGLLPVIGSLYGLESGIVGWITHLFHSIVFGLLFVAFLSRLPPSRFETTVRLAGLGMAWGLVLWLVAAGLVMPLWLNLVGVAAVLPNLTGPGLIGHLIWGGTLAICYAILTPKPTRIDPGWLTLVDR